MKEREIKSLMEFALEKAKALDYCDLRFVDIENHGISYRDASVESDSKSRDKGMAIRVMHEGSWGFSCTPILNQNAILETLEMAKALAVTGATANLERHQLAKKPARKDKWFYPQILPISQVDPRDVHNLLKESCQKIKDHSDKIKVAYSSFRAKSTRWHYMDSEGSDLSQFWTRTGAGIEATASDNDDVQSRNINLRHGKAGGFENILALDLLNKCDVIADQAIALCNAPEPEAGKKDIIICCDQLALQIHESVGHPNELDRVLGWEANFAGTSFNVTEHRNTLKYGSDIVNFVADGNLPGATGTRAYDDDGVPAQKWHIVKDGQFKDYYTTRDTAHYLNQGEESRGCCRADSWSSVPITRIPNVSLEPGDYELNNMISEIEDGFIIDQNRSWSIDQRRDQFQFGVELAWEIKNGKKGRLFKNLVYRGHTVPFWNSCDAICNEKYFEVVGEVYCGKGQPVQVMEMGHGCAPARFRGIDVRPS